MPDLRGTRIYWRPASPDAGEKPVQILKNSGYISVALQAVQYKAKGDFWQRTFGGNDKITVSTQVTWQNGADRKTAAAVQDFRKISVPSINALAIGRNIVLQIPASAEGIELTLSIHAIRNDNLGKTLQMLNSDEFKQPLQLAPVAVGEILAIASLVKKTFTDIEDDALTATYPGILSVDAMDDPVSAGRIVQGFIIVIVKQDGDDELDFDPKLLSVTGNRVLLNQQPLSNTYMVYNVTFDKWKGVNQTSASSKKFAEASSKADDLIFADPGQRQSIISSAHDLLMQGKGLLDADDTYRNEEKGALTQAAFQAVADKIRANTVAAAQPTTTMALLEASPVQSPFLVWLTPSAEDRAAVSAYSAELAHSGLTLGLAFNAGSGIAGADHSPGVDAV